MTQRHGGRSLEPLSWVAAALLSLGFLTAHADAQRIDTQAPSLAVSAQQRLVVLQSSDRVAREVAEEVDRVLAGAISSHVPSATLYISPVPFGDVELAAGCNQAGREADCLQRVAGSLGADWVLVRELHKDRTGKVSVTLIAHDGPQAVVTRRAVAQLAAGQQAPAQVIPMLIDRLYPIQYAGDRPVRESRSLEPAKVVGWSSAAVGSGMLAAGITMGALSRRDHDKYERTQVRDRADADAARDALERSQQRARIANGLLIGGASAGAAGALALLWQYIRPKPDAEKPVRMGVAPYRGGFKVSVNGTWQGRL